MGIAGGYGDDMQASNRGVLGARVSRYFHLKEGGREKAAEDRRLPWAVVRAAQLSGGVAHFVV